jgi:hypothetical protein
MCVTTLLSSFNSTVLSLTTRAKHLVAQRLINNLIAKNHTIMDLNEKNQKIVAWLLSHRSPHYMDDTTMTQRADTLAQVGIRIVLR